MKRTGQIPQRNPKNIRNKPRQSVRQNRNGSIQLTPEAHTMLTDNIVKQLQTSTNKKANLSPSSIPDYQEDPNSKRNFYFRLFQIYSGLSFDECMSSYSKIFNDVFLFEKPLSVQRYYVTEVQVVELNETFDYQIRAMNPLTVNFTEGTSR